MKTRLFIVIITVLIFGCRPIRNQEASMTITSSGLQRLHTKDIPVVEKYTLVRYDFYIESKGELFVKKLLAIDSEEEEQESIYDSTMFYPEYPKRIPLKRMIDIPSYEEFGETQFSKDKNHVYFVRPTSGGGLRFLIKRAEPKTFSPLASSWSNDERNVFWEHHIVKGADVKTFRVDETNPDAAVDKNSAYLNGRRVGKNERTKIKTTE